jgi:hypothetical protein
MYICEAHQPYSLTFICFVHELFPSPKYPPHTQFTVCLSFLIPRSMFRGASPYF